MANESDNGLTRKVKNTDRELPECPKVYHLSESPGHILFFPKCGRSEDPALLVLRKGLGRFLVGSKRKIQSQSTLPFTLFLPWFPRKVVSLSCSSESLLLQVLSPGEMLGMTELCTDASERFVSYRDTISSF